MYLFTVQHYVASRQEPSLSSRLAKGVFLCLPGCAKRNLAGIGTRLWLAL
jgi:hypothetical protein